MRPRLWTLPVLFLGICGMGAAQGAYEGCASGFNSGAVVCNIGSCQQSITIETPLPGNSPYVCTTVPCCGQGSWQYCYWDVYGGCYWVELNDPAIRKRLLELAQMQDILVVSCKGEYRPLTAVLSEEPMVLRRRAVRLPLAEGR